MERRKDAPISYKCSLSSSLVRQLVSQGQSAPRMVSVEGEGSSAVSSESGC
jgi:hypothetical protein